jgi:hypothetical protein
VAVNNVHVIVIQLEEGSAETLDDVLARQASCVWDIVGLAPKDFGGEYEMMSGDIEGVKCNSDLFFSLAVTYMN